MDTETLEPVPNAKGRKAASPKPKKRRYQAELFELARRVELALRLLHKCKELPELAQAAVELLEE